MTEPIDDTAALLAHWKKLNAPKIVSAVGVSVGTSTANAVSGSAMIQLEPLTLDAVGFVGEGPARLPGIAVGAVLVEAGRKGRAGQLILAVTPAWRKFLDEATRDAGAFFGLDPRQFEEFTAGAYEEEGFQVTLTPRSGDRGRDIIASRSDLPVGPVKLLVQVKRLKPGSLVTADDVRALFGVLSRDQAASKAVFTTTSRFAPGVYKEFADPTRLELRDGKGLQQWIRRIHSKL